MNSLSQTRSAREPTHLLQTPDAFVRTPLPGIEQGVAIVHAAPALGAGFLQYTAELMPGGRLERGAEQRFLYVLEGTGALTLGEGSLPPALLSPRAVRPGSYAYLPPQNAPGAEAILQAESSMRVVVIEKRYVPRPHAFHANFDAPKALAGHADEVEPVALNGDTGVMVRQLLPADFSFDFAVNTMTYAPGAALSQVEIHVMEHGLLMLEGAGPYRLGERFYDVRAGDFIWMSPFCPQWFQASAEKPAKYLIYKDCNRMPAL